MLCVSTESLYPKGMCGRPAIFKNNFCKHFDKQKFLVFMEKSTAIQEDVTRAKVDEPSDDRLDCGNKALNTPESSHHTSSPYGARFFII